MSTAVDVLKDARRIWPDVIDEKFLSRYIDDGLLSRDEAKEVLREKPE